MSHFLLIVAALTGAGGLPITAASDAQVEAKVLGCLAYGALLLISLRGLRLSVAVHPDFLVVRNMTRTRTIERLAVKSISNRRRLWPTDSQVVVVETVDRSVVLQVSYPLNMTRERCSELRSALATWLESPRR